jgi:emfourin
MKVQFVQSGGVVGAVKGCELDTAALAPERAQELERLVRESGLSGSHESLSDTGRDLLQYEITLEDENRKSKVVVDDSTIPQSAKPLLGFLKKCAEPKSLR